MSQNTDSKQKFARSENVPKMLLKQVVALEIDNNAVYHRGQPVQYVHFIARIVNMTTQDNRADIQFSDDTGFIIANVFKSGNEFPPFIKDISEDDLQSSYFTVLVFVRVFKGNIMYVAQNVALVKDYNHLSSYLLNIMRIEKNPQKQDYQPNPPSQIVASRYEIQEELPNSNLIQDNVPSISLLVFRSEATSN